MESINNFIKEIKLHKTAIDFIEEKSNNIVKKTKLNIIDEEKKN